MKIEAGFIEVIHFGDSITCKVEGCTVSINHGDKNFSDTWDDAEDVFLCQGCGATQRFERKRQMRRGDISDPLASNQGA